MTANDDWLARVCLGVDSRLPDFDSVARREPGAITAGVISKPRLVLATVRFGARGLPTIDSARCGTFELAGRSARALEGFSRQAAAFVGRHRIDNVYLRSKSENGEFVGHALNFKMEAALQLVPGLSISFLNTNSIGAWVRRAEPVLPPGGEPSLGAYWALKHEKAVEAALFVAEHYNQARFFSDGSATNG